MNDWQSYIVINPEIRFGKPSIIGTRITVGDILGWYAAGMSEAEIMDDFPSLKPEHLRAALYFAAHREQNIMVLASGK
jgi:uncharacterized protein (DUF433 family)